jgi:hypothetical protein
LLSVSIEVAGGCSHGFDIGHWGNGYLQGIHC